MAKGENKSKDSGEARPPVVVVLGHVDHGKTTLLDWIRKTNVAGRESGGITQHIGAYVIEHDGRSMTFLDTPGHAAFSAMRRRGAQVADIAILVVAADDGVQPQTKEALEAIRTAKIPFVVAINKIDKVNADIQKTKTDLTNADVLLEGWGGDVPNIEISAKEGKGVNELLEIVQLVGDIAELTGDPAKPAEGVIIEAHRDSRRGIVVTLLVKDGTMRIGDVLLAGAVAGKVKALEDFKGAGIQEARPSTPAIVLGFSDVPDVGDAVRVVADEAQAQEAAGKEEQQRAFEQVIAEGDVEIELPVVIRADVLGSLEAIVNELEKLKNAHVAIRIAGAATGEISESTIRQAATQGALLVGFRVKARDPVLQFAEREDVTIKTFDVIYELTDAVREAARNRLPKIVHREDVGTLELLGAFKYTHPDHVVGGRVESGVARKGVLLEAVRDDTVVVRAKLVDLQQNKIPVDEVSVGNECGMLIRYETGGPVQIGDIVHFFTETVETPEL